MRCHYEVLEVARDVQDDELKKAYRKLALKWHPDKNQDDSEVATERFKEIQNSYAVLSDPHERSWYDAHRDSILRGGSGVKCDGGGGDAEDEFDLWAYFSSSAYSGFGDDEDGFYSVYAKVFSDLADDESRHGKATRPTFGKSTSEWSSVRDFYAYWEGFSTARSCAGADLYDTRQAPNRQVRRAMEKENNKARAELKRKLNECVRNLVAYVKKRDRRVMAHTEQQEAEKAAKAAKMAEMRKAKQAEYDAERKRVNQQLATSRNDEEEEELERIDQMLNEYSDDEDGGAARRKGKKGKKKGCGGRASAGAVEAGSSSCAESKTHHTSLCEEADETSPWAIYDEFNQLTCVACNKTFKNHSQWSNHEKSKKHLESVKQLRAELEAEDEEFGLSAQAEEEAGADADASADADDGTDTGAELAYSSGGDVGDDDDDMSEQEGEGKGGSHGSICEPRNEGDSDSDDAEEDDDEDAMLRRMAGTASVQRQTSKGLSAAKASAPESDEEESSEAREEGEEDAMLQQMAAASLSSASTKRKTPRSPGDETAPVPPCLPPASAPIQIDDAAESVETDDDSEAEFSELSSNYSDKKSSVSARNARAPAVLGKSKAKAKKSLRKAAQEAGAKAMSDHCCAVCGYSGATRNLLFKHLKETGHAVAPRR